MGHLEGVYCHVLYLGATGRPGSGFPQGMYVSNLKLEFIRYAETQNIGVAALTLAVAQVPNRTAAYMMNIGNDTILSLVLSFSLSRSPPFVCISFADLSFADLSPSRSRALSISLDLSRPHFSLSSLSSLSVPVAGLSSVHRRCAGWRRCTLSAPRSPDLTRHDGPTWAADSVPSAACPSMPAKLPRPLHPAAQPSAVHDSGRVQLLLYYKLNLSGTPPTLRRPKDLAS